MDITPDVAGSTHIKRTQPRSVVVFGMTGLLVLTLLGVLVVDPGQSSSVALLGVLAMFSVPTAAALGRPTHRAPWPVFGVGAFLVLAEVSMRGGHPAFAGPTLGAFDTNLAASVLFGLLLASEVWMIRSRPPYSGAVDDRDTGVVIALCFVAAFAGAIAVADARWGPALAQRGWPLFVVGIGLGLGGLALRGWAIATLGRFFQPRLVVQPDHQVVSDGPYRLVRHPSYTGPILLFVGIGLLLNSWAGLAIAVLLPIGAYARRIDVEEAMLTDGLGTAYERYRDRTWRILPGVW